MWNEPERAQALGKERSALELVVKTIGALDSGCEEIQMLVDMAVEESDQDSFDEAVSEADELEKEIGSA